MSTKDFYYRGDRPSKEVRQLLRRIYLSPQKIVTDFEKKTKVFNAYQKTVGNYKLRTHPNNVWINNICDENNKRIENIRKEYDVKLEPLLLQITSLKQEIKKNEEERESAITKIITDYNRLADENRKKIAEFNDIMNNEFQTETLEFLHAFCVNAGIDIQSDDDNQEGNV